MDLSENRTPIVIMRDGNVSIWVLGEVVDMNIQFEVKQESLTEFSKYRLTTIDG